MFNFSKKGAANDTCKFDNENFSILDKLLGYRFIAPSQHKKISNKFNLLHTKKRSKTSQPLFLRIISHKFFTCFFNLIKV